MKRQADGPGPDEDEPWQSKVQPDETDSAAFYGGDDLESRMQPRELQDDWAAFYGGNDPWSADFEGAQFGAAYFGAGYFGACTMDGWGPYGEPWMGDTYGMWPEEPPPEAQRQQKKARPKKKTSSGELKRPLRVIVVLPRLLRGGAEQWLLYLAKFLNREKVKLVRCVVANAQVTDRQFIEELPIPVEEKGPDSMRRAVADCDVLVVFGLPCDTLLGAERAKLCVYIAHGEGPWTKGLLDRSRKRCDHVIAVSRRVKQAVCDGFPTTVIYNGVDMARVAQRRSRREVRRRFHFGEHDFVVGYVGRFSQEKQLDLLIRAVSKLPPRFKLLLVGWGHLKARLLELANELIPGRYAFTGGSQYLGDYYRAMDAFALVSNQEGFSLALLEAMMCRLPVVVTPVGCVPELIVNRVNGVVVKPRIRDVAKGLARVANFPSWARGVAAEGHRWAIDNGHAERMARDYEAVLLRLWAQKHGGRK